MTASDDQRSPERLDIQGLRAIAVVAVITAHAAPTRYPGGRAGVDVFLVISGFLVTRILIAAPIRTPADAVRFWARRGRRLVPAATCVLVATAVAALVWFPATARSRLAHDVAASALYVENWHLARASTDYFGSEDLRSATQHFWSLAVEGQFYLVWPVVMGLLSLLARRRGPRLVLGGLMLVTVGSLIWSVVETRADAAAAYFVSTTRLWELALGGVAAVIVREGLAPRARAVRVWMAWMGLLAVVWSILAFDATTPWPGVAALVPTIGTACILVVDSDGLPRSPARFLALRPIQWTGDVSYSLYLWHWPVLVVAPFAFGRPTEWPTLLGLLAISFALAGLSKRYVEDRTRFRPARELAGFGGSTRRTVILLAACLILSLGGAKALARSARIDPPAAPTVEASAPTTVVTPTEEAVMQAQADRPAVYADGCWSIRPFADHITCNYGAAESPDRIALFGNSHAGQWHTPIAAAADANGWSVDTYLASECYSVDLPIDFGDAKLTRNCSAFNSWALERIEDGAYDVIVMSDRTSLNSLIDVEPSRRSEVTQESFDRVIDRILDTGADVLVIRDTPVHDEFIPDCAATHLGDPTACATPRSTALGDDPLAAAALLRQDARVRVMDPTDRMCDPEQCYGVIDGLVAYADSNHLTSTFSATFELRLALELQPSFAEE